MRNAFVAKLTEMARDNEKILLLVGDAGFGVFENFKKEFPKRYFNFGIAEQNSIGVISGLSKEGFFPIFYTIIPFLLFRPFEQIRNDLCINRRDALLVGVGAGLSYGALGPTHHALEDIGVMSTLPEMRIYTPSSPLMVDKILDEAIVSGSGPAYLRLGKNGESNLTFDSADPFMWLPIRIKNPFKKILILVHGSISKSVEDAIFDSDFENLITFGVIEQIKPFPITSFLEQLRETELIITIEEHYEVGGLFEKVLSAANTINYNGRIKNINVPYRFVTEVGNHEDLLNVVELSRIKLKEKICEFIQGH